MQIKNMNNSTVCANGMVASSQPLAVNAGLKMLETGGNAVDAAIATAVALTVVEPTSNGIGGDAFAIVWDGKKLQGLNASGKSPTALSLDVSNKSGAKSIPEKGWLAVTVPGAPSAWKDLHERYGQLPLEQIFEPAISYAENGFEISPVVAQNWAKSVHRFSPLSDPACAHWMSTFSDNAQSPKAGQTWYFPDHASTLNQLLNCGIDDFYQGQLGQRILDFSQATGGYISARDLAEHRNLWVDPISTCYRGIDVYEIPPNGQGLAALIALSILNKNPVGQEKLTAASIHRHIEAMKLGCVDAYQHITDPTACKGIEDLLLDEAYIKSREKLITEKAAAPIYGTSPNAGTVYLATADKNGMMVSYIQSNYDGFGSGVVIPQTGIAMQNRGAGFSMQASHPNVLAGGKRPFHTIIPGFLMKQGQAIGPFGVMGGFMQPQGHLQVVTAMLDYGLDPQSALNQPRWRVIRDKKIEVENSMDTKVIDELIARGHDIEIVDDVTSFGRGQIILKYNGQYIAGSDMRADGMAKGY